MLLTAKVEEIIVLEAVDGLEGTTDVKLLGRVEEVLGAGVGVVVGAKDVLGLLDPAAC